MQEYQTIFEKMIMEETLAEMMQGSESAELITPQPAVLTSSSNVRLAVLYSALCCGDCGTYPKCFLWLPHLPWPQRSNTILRMFVAARGTA